MLWAASAMWLGLSIQAWWYGQEGFGGFSLVAIMMFFNGFVWWERLGFQRQQESREAEIKRLRGMVAAHSLAPVSTVHHDAGTLTPASDPSHTP